MDASAAVRVRAVLPVVALVVVAVLELVLHAVFAESAPRFEAYAALEEPLGGLIEEGDVLTVSPPWIEPMVRQGAPGSLSSLRRSGPPSHRETPAVVDVSLRGETGALPVGWHEAARRDVGPFVVRRLVNDAYAAPVADFLALSPSDVTLSSGAVCMFDPRAQPVAGGLGGHPTWGGGRFRCPGPAFVTVSPTAIADRDFRPRRCLLAHPPARGELAVHYETVLLGDRLVGHAGLSWMRERARRFAPIELRFEVDGVSIGNVIHADGDGWKRFELEVPPSSERRRDVSVFVSSPDAELGNRDICFEVRSR